jgi:hypothetical protein
MTGKTFGKYRIVDQLGRGGMGTVYRAVDEVLGREVAVKILSSRLADSQMMDRFRHEAILLARLSHPRIATIYELFRSDAALLMVMELVRGETLDSILNRVGPLPPDLAAFVMDQMLSALEHAHRAGIVHRDLKPANVMVAEQGDLKVMDFGVARMRTPEHADSCLVGTPAYMPPEQILGDGVDTRGDLYSAGVVFYRLLTGALPFTADSALVMLRKQLSNSPAPLGAHRTDIPDWCQAIVERALAKMPTDRFQSAESFRQALTDAGGMTVNLGAALASHIAARTASGTPEPSGPHLPVSPASDDAADSVSTAMTTGSAGGERTVVLEMARVPLRQRPWLVVAVIAAVATSFAGWRLTAARDGSRREEAVPAAVAAAISQPVAEAPAGGETAPQVVAAVAPIRTAAKAPPSPRTPVAALGSSAGSRAKPASSRDASSKAPGATSSEPFAFRAKTLIAEGERWRERDCQVVVDGHMTVRASDEDRVLLDAVPYASVLSVSYSRGRHPLWNGPGGPAPAARAGRGTLGLFRGDRHWLTLRTSRPALPFVVLRLENEAQLLRVITAIEARTGRTVQVVGETSD